MTRLYDRSAGAAALAGVLLLVSGLLAVPQRAAAATAVDLVAVADCEGKCSSKVNDKKDGCVVTNSGCAGVGDNKCGCSNTSQYNEAGTEVISCSASCKRYAVAA